MCIRELCRCVLYRRSASKLNLRRSYQYRERCIYAPDSIGLNHPVPRSQSQNLENTSTYCMMGSSDAALSANGRWILSAWCDGIMKVRISSRRVLSLLERHTKIVSAARFSSWNTLQHLWIRWCDCDRRAMCCM